MAHTTSNDEWSLVDLLVQLRKWDLNDIADRIEDVNEADLLTQARVLNESMGMLMGARMQGRVQRKQAIPQDVFDVVCKLGMMVSEILDGIQMVGTVGGQVPS